MKFTFEQTPDDLRDLSKSSFTQNKVVKIVAAVLLILVTINLLPAILKGEASFAVILEWIIPIIIIIVFWYFLFNFLLKKQWKDPANEKLMIGKREIEFLEEEILVNTPVSKTSYQWSAISKMTKSNNSYFLFLGKNQALIIPKRIFSTLEEERALEDFVNERIVK